MSDTGQTQQEETNLITDLRNHFPIFLPRLPEASRWDTLETGGIKNTNRTAERTESLELAVMNAFPMS